MAWCATRNRSRRSSGLYSAFDSGSVSAECGELSGDWDIALPPPGKDEGTTAAFHNLPIDLGPEGGEVVARRHQRENHHEPDRNMRNDVHGKEVTVINRPFFPAMVENHSHHRNDLHHHLELS